jgi:hypothetical protein
MLQLLPDGLVEVADRFQLLFPRQVLDSEEFYRAVPTKQLVADSDHSRGSEGTTVLTTCRKSVAPGAPTSRRNVNSVNDPLPTIWISTGGSRLIDPILHLPGDEVKTADGQVAQKVQ